MTRTLLPAIILLSVLFTYSCSKSNNDNPTPTPPVDTTTPVKADTLTAGWTKQRTDTFALSDVFFSNNTTGYTMIEYGRLYKTIDGGISWTIKSDSISGGQNLSVTNNGNIHYVNADRYVYTSVNGGSNFSSTRLNSIGYAFDIFFPDDNNGFTVCGGNLFQTTDGGINWSGVFPTTGLSLSPAGFYSLFFLNDTTGWICGEGKSYKSNGNLHNWIESNLPSASSSGLIFIHAPSASVVYEANAKNVFKSVDSGRTFSSIYTLNPLVNSISDIHFTDINTGYVSFGNRIYKTINGGTSWVPVVALGGSSNMVEIHFTDANHGWGCTSDGYILRYSM